MFSRLYSNVIISSQLSSFVTLVVRKGTTFVQVVDTFDFIVFW